jgi:hypothetical protein
MSFGQGPSLDRNLDFEVDSTGDIRSTNGENELIKDLSVQLIFTLQKFLGETPSRNTQTRALSDAITVVEADSRVDTVLRETSSVSLQEGRSATGRTIDVNLNIITIDETTVNLRTEVTEQ